MFAAAVTFLLALAQDPALPADWAELIAPAASLDPDDRSTARAALEKKVTPQRELLKKLAKADHRALVIAGLLGEQGTRGNLIGLLKSEDLTLRRGAAEAMATAPGDGGIDTLGGRLDDPDLATAMAAARALARTKKGGLAELRRHRGSKDARKALIAAYGIELAEGGELGFIQRSMKDEVGYVVGTNTPSVIDTALHAIDDQFKREDAFKAPFEKEDLSDVARDALGTFRIRAGCIDATGALDYLKWPATKPTPWAVERVPRLRIHRSCVAYAVVKLIEERAKAKKEDELRHAAALEAVLQKSCGIAAPEGDLETRAKAYREWYDRVASTLVDVDVVRAIDDGVAWLKARQEKDGSWLWCKCGYKTYANIHHQPGQTALAGYTLVKMDVPHDDPSVVKAATYLLDMPITAVTDDPTYSLSLQAMFLAELVQAQKAKKDRKTKVESALTPRCIKRIQECVDWLVEAHVTLDKGGYENWAWTYNKPVGDTKTHDHSNTQFALLGLLAGQNVGAKVPPKAWQASLNHWKGEQYKEGGWYYSPLPEDTKEQSKVGSVSMTGAGLSSVLIAEAALKREATEKVAQSQDAAKRAIAKWEKSYPIQPPARYGNQGHVFSIYYDLYCVERAMMLAGVQRLGGKDWYHDGALYILWNQMHSGAWLDTSDTCFALLFLKKAYIPVATGEK